jgi:homoserine kinase
LGSSAAAIVAGVMAANLLSAERLPPAELMRIAVELEGHPDNVIPALVGGMTAATYNGKTLVARKIPTKPLVAAVALPLIASSTSEQRAALPQSVPLADAAYNIGQAVLVVEAFREGDYTLLADAIADRLHTPTRSKAIPAYAKVVRAAKAAGAAAVTVSGAGPAVIAFAERGLDKICQAMFLAFKTEGVKAHTWSLPLDVDGFRMEPPV